MLNLPSRINDCVEPSVRIEIHGYLVSHAGAVVGERANEALQRGCVEDSVANWPAIHMHFKNTCELVVADLCLEPYLRHGLALSGLPDSFALNDQINVTAV